MYSVTVKELDCIIVYWHEQGKKEFDLVTEETRQDETTGNIPINICLMLLGYLLPLNLVI